MNKKLTEKYVQSLEPDTVGNKDYFVWDEELRGFGIRVKPSGVKTFMVQYRNVYKRSARLSLGQYGRITAAQARKEAKIKLAQVAQGGDPAAERREARAAKTVADLCDDYWAAAEAGRVMSRGKPKKASTLYRDRSRIERHIKPLLGRRALEELSRRDIERFMHEVIDGKTAKIEKTKKHGLARVSGGPGTASKCVSLLSSMMSYAINKGWLEANPCQGVQKPADNRRDRFLRPGEYEQLGAALAGAKKEGGNPVALHAIEVLALTGCRKGEILNLKWTEVDPEGQCLRFEDSKTGKQIRPCARIVFELLNDLPGPRDDIWVFPSSRGGGPLVNLRKPFVGLCARAKLEDVTIHALRHSFATVANELGYSELTIAGLLGHSSHSITARYAHHVDRALAQAADQVAGVVRQRLKGEVFIQAGNVISLSSLGNG